MKIKCKQIRDGGTKVPMGKKEYHFAPDENGDHVADVTNKAHIDRFLAITEGYEEVGAKASKAAKSTEPPAVEVTPEAVAVMGIPELRDLAGKLGIGINNELTDDDLVEHIEEIRAEVTAALEKAE